MCSFFLQYMEAYIYIYISIYICECVNCIYTLYTSSWSFATTIIGHDSSLTSATTPMPCTHFTCMMTHPCTTYKSEYTNKTERAKKNSRIRHALPASWPHWYWLINRTVQELKFKKRHMKKRGLVNLHGIIVLQQKPKDYEFDYR